MKLFKRKATPKQTIEQQIISKYQVGTSYQALADEHEVQVQDIIRVIEQGGLLNDTGS